MKLVAPSVLVIENRSSKRYLSSYRTLKRTASVVSTTSTTLQKLFIVSRSEKINCFIEPALDQLQSKDSIATAQVYRGIKKLLTELGSFRM